MDTKTIIVVVMLLLFIGSVLWMVIEIRRAPLVVENELGEGSGSSLYAELSLPDAPHTLRVDELSVRTISVVLANLRSAANAADATTREELDLAHQEIIDKLYRAQHEPDPEAYELPSLSRRQAE